MKCYYKRSFKCLVKTFEERQSAVHSITEYSVSTRMSLLGIA